MPARWSRSSLLGFGLLRGLIWAREIRFFTVAMLLTLLYALGRYTPVFHLMYDFLPGVTLFRRPADATFVLCALLAMIAGYLVHRLLTGTVPRADRWQRVAEIALAVALIGDRCRAGAIRSACCRAPRCRSCWGVGFAAAAIGALLLARRLAPHGALAAAAVLAVFSVVDLGWNNAPNEFDRPCRRRSTTRCAPTPRTRPSPC